MIPGVTGYFAPTSVAEAVQLLEAHGQRAAVLAGGHSLLPAIRLRGSGPEALIDIGRIPDLTGIRQEDGCLVIGAMVTHATLEAHPTVKKVTPALSEAAAQIGDPQVRHRGTIGGSAAHADPAADYSPVLLAHGARFDVIGPRGKYTVSAQDFFQGPFANTLGRADVLIAIRVPEETANSGSAYLKAPRRGSHFGLVCAAARVEVNGGRCQSARVALGAVTGRPYRAPSVETALVGRDLEDEKAITAAAAQAVADCVVRDEPDCSAEFRAHVAMVYVRRALTAAITRVSQH